MSERRSLTSFSFKNGLLIGSAVFFFVFLLHLPYFQEGGSYHSSNSSGHRRDDIIGKDGDVHDSLSSDHRTGSARQENDREDSSSQRGGFFDSVRKRFYSSEKGDSSSGEERLRELKDRLRKISDLKSDSKGIEIKSSGLSEDYVTRGELEALIKEGRYGGEVRSLTSSELRKLIESSGHGSRGDVIYHYGFHQTWFDWFCGILNPFASVHTFPQLICKMIFWTVVACAVWYYAGHLITKAWNWFKDVLLWGWNKVKDGFNYIVGKVISVVTMPIKYVWNKYLDGLEKFFGRPLIGSEDLSSDREVLSRVQRSVVSENSVPKKPEDSENISRPSSPPVDTLNREKQVDTTDYVLKKEEVSVKDPVGYDPNNPEDQKVLHEKVVIKGRIGYDPYTKSIIPLPDVIALKKMTKEEIDQMNQSRQVNDPINLDDPPVSYQNPPEVVIKPMNIYDNKVVERDVLVPVNVKKKKRFVKVNGKTLLEPLVVLFGAGLAAGSVIFGRRSHDNGREEDKSISSRAGKGLADLALITGAMYYYLKSWRGIPKRIDKSFGDE